MKARIGPTVYVIDDDASVRKALGRLLYSAGMAHQTFASGDEFLRSVSAKAKGCVIMDMRMPQMTGLEVQAKMREQGYGLPVIGLSAIDDAETRELARELGAVGFFGKPVDDQALLDAIQWVIPAKQPDF